MLVLYGNHYAKQCARRSRSTLQVHCFGEQYGGVAKSRVSLTLAPRNGQGYAFSLNVFVYQKITSCAGSRSESIDSWSHLHNLNLANPDPCSNHPIHLLIGADLYGSLLLPKLKQNLIGTPTTQLTVLGGIISGPSENSNLNKGSVHSRNCV